MPSPKSNTIAKIIVFVGAIALIVLIYNPDMSLLNSDTEQDTTTIQKTIIVPPPTRKSVSMLRDENSVVDIPESYKTFINQQNDLAKSRIDYEIKKLESDKILLGFREREALANTLSTEAASQAEIASLNVKLEPKENKYEDKDKGLSKGESSGRSPVKTKKTSPFPKVDYNFRSGNNSAYLTVDGKVAKYSVGQSFNGLKLLAISPKGDYLSVRHISSGVKKDIFMSSPKSKNFSKLEPLLETSNNVNSEDE